jgi:hypothetical protein
MRAQCVLVATALLHSGAKFHSFLYTGSKTVRVNMESCYGGMSTRLKQRAKILYFTSYFPLFKYMVSFPSYFTVSITYQPPLLYNALL